MRMHWRKRGLHLFAVAFEQRPEVLHVFRLDVGKRGVRRRLRNIVRRLRHFAGHLVARGGEGGRSGVETNPAKRDVGGRGGEDGVAFAG